MKTYDWIVIGGGITGAALAFRNAPLDLCGFLRTDEQLNF